MVLRQANFLSLSKLVLLLKYLLNIWVSTIIVLHYRISQLTRIVFPEMIISIPQRKPLPVVSNTLLLSGVAFLVKVFRMRSLCTTMNDFADDDDDYDLTWSLAKLALQPTTPTWQALLKQQKWMMMHRNQERCCACENRVAFFKYLTEKVMFHSITTIWNEYESLRAKRAIRGAKWDLTKNIFSKGLF